MNELLIFFAANCRIESPPLPKKKNTDKQAYKTTHKNEDIYTGITLPTTITPRPHLHIVDPQKFVETNLARLDCGSWRLERLAVANLTALKNLLEQPTI